MVVLGYAFLVRVVFCIPIIVCEFYYTVGMDGKKYGRATYSCYSLYFTTGLTIFAMYFEYLRAHSKFTQRKVATEWMILLSLLLLLFAAANLAISGNSLRDNAAPSKLNKASVGLNTVWFVIELFVIVAAIYSIRPDLVADDALLTDEEADVPPNFNITEYYMWEPVTIGRCFVEMFRSLSLFLFATGFCICAIIALLLWCLGAIAYGIAAFIVSCLEVAFGNMSDYLDEDNRTTRAIKWLRRQHLFTPPRRELGSVV